MYTYTLTAGSSILRSDGAFIPPDPMNTDYAAYLAWVATGQVAAPAPTPTLTGVQQLAQTVATALVAGLTVNSTSTPEINGTYPIDPTSQFDIASVTNYVTVNGDFPGGASIYPWEDINGGFHIFPNVTLFKAWATAIADYVAQLKLYQAQAPGVGLPASAVTIV